MNRKNMQFPIKKRYTNIWQNRKPKNKCISGNKKTLIYQNILANVFRRTRKSTTFQKLSKLSNLNELFCGKSSPRTQLCIFRQRVLTFVIRSINLPNKAMRPCVPEKFFHSMFSINNQLSVCSSPGYSAHVLWSKRATITGSIWKST